MNLEASSNTGNAYSVLAENKMNALALLNRTAEQLGQENPVPINDGRMGAIGTRALSGLDGALRAQQAQGAQQQGDQAPA